MVGIPRSLKSDEQEQAFFHAMLHKSEVEATRNMLQLLLDNYTVKTRLVMLEPGTTAYNLSKLNEDGVIVENVPVVMQEFFGMNVGYCKEADTLVASLRVS